VEKGDRVESNSRSIHQDQKTIDGVSVRERLSRGI